MEENLNIEDNKNILIRKAFLKFKTQREVAEALGCSERYLVYKIKELNINIDKTLIS